MKVLALTGDSDRSENALLCGLSRKGVEIDLIGTPSPEFEKALFDSGIGVTPLHCISRVHPAAIRLIRRKLAIGNYDIIHAFTNRTLSNTLLASAGYQVKRVAYRGTMGHISKLDPTAWLSYLNPGLHKISCVSEAVRQYLLERGIPETKLVTIYKGHDISWYPKNAALDLAQFEVPPGAFVVACTANMRPVKGVDVLVKAIEVLPEDIPVHLLLIGEVRDPLLKDLLRKSPASKKIHLTGFRKDAVQLVGSSSAFVMPSRKREGLPKAVIEAMAQEIPAIVTAVGGMPELVRDGVDGLIVPPSDHLALAKAIEKLFKNPDETIRMGRKAKERIATDFTIQSTIERTFSVYQELTA